MASVSGSEAFPQDRKEAVLAAFKQRLLQLHGKGVERLLDEGIEQLLRQKKAISTNDLTCLENSARNSARDARDRRLAERNSRQASEAGSQAGVRLPKSGQTSSRPDSADTYRNSNVGQPQDARAGPGSVRSATPRGSGRHDERAARAKDQWDLIIRYDKRNFEAEEAKKAASKRGLTQSYRKDLDSQMARVYEKRHELLQERGRDNQAMQEEQRKVDREVAAEKAEQARKVEVMREAQTRAKLEREKIEQREADRRKRERDHLLMQVKREEMEDAERERLRKEQQRRGAKEIVASMQEQMEARNRRRVEEAKEDKLMAERYLREQDRKEREREAAVQARKDHLEFISKRMGTGLVLEKENKEKADELSMIKAQAEMEKRFVEDAARKKEQSAKRISEMKDVLAIQIEEKQKRTQLMRKEELEQGAIFAKQSAQASVEDRELVQRRREQRRILDTYLAKQIEGNRSHRDGLEKTMPHLARREVELNQSIFREMQKDGFNPPETDKYLLK